MAAGRLDLQNMLAWEVDVSQSVYFSSAIVDPSLFPIDFLNNKVLLSSRIVFKAALTPGAVVPCAHRGAEIRHAHILTAS